MQDEAESPFQSTQLTRTNLVATNFKSLFEYLCCCQMSLSKWRLKEVAYKLEPELFSIWGKRAVSVNVAFMAIFKKASLFMLSVNIYKLMISMHIRHCQAHFRQMEMHQGWREMRSLLWPTHNTIAMVILLKCKSSHVQTPKWFIVALSTKASILLWLSRAYVMWPPIHFPPAIS